jgi:hypothetical protein
MSPWIFWYARMAWNNGGSPTTPDGILELIKAYLDDPDKPVLEEESKPETPTQGQ